MFPDNLSEQYYLVDEITHHSGTVKEIASKCYSTLGQGLKLSMHIMRSNWKQTYVISWSIIMLDIQASYTKHNTVVWVFQKFNISKSMHFVTCVFERSTVYAIVDLHADKWLKSSGHRLFVK